MVKNAPFCHAIKGAILCRGIEEMQWDQLLPPMNNSVFAALMSTSVFLVVIVTHLGENDLVWHTQLSLRN